jgi:hypothetical protein
MCLQHEIASVFRNILLEVESSLQKTLIEELLEPKLNTGTFHVYHEYHVSLSTPCHPHVLSPSCLVRDVFATVHIYGACSPL